MEKTQCDLCGAILEIPETYFGREAKCSKCGGVWIPKHLSENALVSPIQIPDEIPMSEWAAPPKPPGKDQAQKISLPFNHILPAKGADFLLAVFILGLVLGLFLVLAQLMLLLANYDGFSSGALGTGISAVISSVVLFGFYQIVVSINEIRQRAANVEELLKAIERKSN